MYLNINSNWFVYGKEKKTNQEKNYKRFIRKSDHNNWCKEKIKMVKLKQDQMVNFVLTILVINNKEYPAFVQEDFFKVKYIPKVIN